MNQVLFSPIAIAGLSHHTATVDMLEAFRFPDEEAFLRKAKDRFRGILLLQTCNRIEILVHGEASSLVSLLQEEGREDFSVLSGIDALRHLLELAAGMDSMIIGEDQIIGQLKTALDFARERGCASPVLELCVNKAVHAGIEVRKQTQINRGAVSIGSAAVLLAEEQLGSLEGKRILVVGSGEMGMLVAQALAAKQLTAIYVANRTYGRAEVLAKKIGGKAVRLDDLPRYMLLSDVVISCTSAPHPVIHCDDLKEIMRGRCWPLEGHPRPLILVDIAQPRDVEEGAEAIDGVHLFTIDSLRQINENTMNSRKSEAAKAQVYLDDELAHFIRLLNGKAADDTLAILHTWAESIRTRERDRAISRIGTGDERTREIVDDLTRVLANKILSDVTFSIRLCAEEGDLDYAESLVAAITRGERLCFRNNE
ncbi:MAG TPA: glutamyl-tRNA reductase [Methanoregulaceae archaeon]|jgi:glutamyl-tRNA reductase|nr:glutamyl-tRNA reductase [Methanoregulaceae archaeon]MCC7468296.1 glutamyl-tRNA reductase [Burkholderiaceae bacterium]NLH25939.1 glutamyl-tRNA reductase [Methanomicrobiales archaeon]HNB02702.1 glutamyl-tRNA reductase [Methanoregulaceae archaeon]HPS22341.1 glutamyl-tRNA reductase [Methanoregulaceae archaeon]